MFDRSFQWVLAILLKYLFFRLGWPLTIWQWGQIEVGHTTTKPCLRLCPHRKPYQKVSKERARATNVSQWGKLNRKAQYKSLHHQWNSGTNSGLECTNNKNDDNATQSNRCRQDQICVTTKTQQYTVANACYRILHIGYYTGYLWCRNDKVLSDPSWTEFHQVEADRVAIFELLTRQRGYI